MSTTSASTLPSDLAPVYVQLKTLETAYQEDQAQLAHEYETALAEAQEHPDTADWVQIRTTYLDKTRQQAETYQQARQEWSTLYRQWQAQILRLQRLGEGQP
jgi:hypothetical protein